MRFRKELKFPQFGAGNGACLAVRIFYFCVNFFSIHTKKTSFNGQTVGSNHWMINQMLMFVQKQITRVNWTNIYCIYSNKRCSTSLLNFSRPTCGLYSIRGRRLFESWTWQRIVVKSTVLLLFSLLNYRINVFFIIQGVALLNRGGAYSSKYVRLKRWPQTQRAVQHKELYFTSLETCSKLMSISASNVRSSPKMVLNPRKTCHLSLLLIC